MTFNAQEHARTEFELVLKQRKKEISPALLKTLEDAFKLGNVQRIVDTTESLGLPLHRRIDIHRRQIGKLARGLGQMIATTATTRQIAADDIRLGYARWKETDAFKTVAQRYHHHRVAGDGGWLREQDTAIARLK